MDGIIDYDALSQAEDIKDIFTEATFKNYILYLDWIFTNVRPSRIPFVLPDEGRIGLQHHGGIMSDGSWSGNSSEIQFRNIWVKEI